MSILLVDANAIKNQRSSRRRSGGCDGTESWGAIRFAAKLQRIYLLPQLRALGKIWWSVLNYLGRTRSGLRIVGHFIGFINTLKRILGTAAAVMAKIVF